MGSTLAPRCWQSAAEPRQGHRGGTAPRPQRCANRPGCPGRRDPRERVADGGHGVAAARDHCVPAHASAREFSYFRRRLSGRSRPRSAPAISILPSVWCPMRPRDETLSFIRLVKDHLVPAVRADHPLISAAQASYSPTCSTLTGSSTGAAIPVSTCSSRPSPPTTCRPAEEHDRMHLARLRAALWWKWRLRHAGSLAGVFRRPHAPRSIALLPLDLPMQPWQVAVISRAKHELSVVGLAFLAEIERVATKIDPPKGSGRRAGRTRP